MDRVMVGRGWFGFPWLGDVADPAGTVTDRVPVGRRGYGSRRAADGSDSGGQAIACTSGWEGAP